MTFVAQVRSSIARCAALSLIVLGLFGCATVPMGEPSSSVETAEILQAADLAPATAGTFDVAPGKDQGLDTRLGGLRGSMVKSPSGSFSQHLKQQIIADLKSAGLYDPNSGTVIEAQLTDSMVDAAISTGVARLAARFTVTRAGKQVFDKELAVDDEWESSFVGAVAVPRAINRYSALYKALAAKLFEDPAFRAALKG